MEALEAAGVRVDVKTAEEATAMWTFDDERGPLYDALRTRALMPMTMVESPFVDLMTDPVSMRNTRGYHREMGLAYNLPASAMLLAKAAVVHYGRAFLADPVWAKKYGTSSSRRRHGRRSLAPGSCPSGCHAHRGALASRQT